MILFFSTLFVGKFFIFLLNKIIQKIGMSFFDRILGVFFGILRGIFIIYLVLFFIEYYKFFLKIKNWGHFNVILIMKNFFNFLQKLIGFLKI